MEPETFYGYECYVVLYNGKYYDMVYLETLEELYECNWLDEVKEQKI